jgi:hypothetical protein
LVVAVQLASAAPLKNAVPNSLERSLNLSSRRQATHIRELNGRVDDSFLFVS